ncbi:MULTISPECIES: hypothetical protein [unclassified Microcoleus]
MKAPAYARSGIREYWILDINARRLYVFPEPGLSVMLARLCWPSRI